MVNGDVFSSLDMYLLSSIKSDKENSLYKEILGTVCTLEFFRMGESGWFVCDPVQEDIGKMFAKKKNLIRTSSVKDIDVLESGDVIITTMNSVYTFTRLDDSLTEEEKVEVNK